MNTAVRDDPRDWEPRYGLAIVLAATGGDPRPAALALNPYDPVLATAEAKFRTDRRARWPDDAVAAPLPIYGQYGSQIAGLRTSSH